MLTQRPTPAFMSQEAAERLPRFALAAVLAAFILSSFWADGLWTLRDAAGFGVAHAMNEGDALAWLLPRIGETFYAESGPLAGWAAAAFMGLFSRVLGEVGAYRLTSVFWFAVSTSAVWASVWNLSRRLEAQPVTFAFGGQAQPPSYARTTSSCAALLFVSTIGIATRQYEPIPETALVALAAVGLYGVTLSLKRPVAGALLTGLASGFAMLAASLASGFWLLGAAVTAHAALRTIPANRDHRISAVVLSALLPLALWLSLAFLLDSSAASRWTDLWLHTQVKHFDIADAKAILWLSRTFFWYLLPLWPLALWALYSWRRQLDRTQILLPAIYCGTSLFAGFFTSPSGAGTLLLMLVPPCVVLATFGLVTLRRTRENLLDWFALSVNTVALLALWLYWLASLTGIAPKMAKSIDMLAPGLEVQFNASVIAAFAATVVWGVFVVWRLTHRPVVIWRGPWLSAAGMTAVSITLLGLWHQGIDVNRSYSGVAQELKASITKLAGSTVPISGDDIPGGVRAALNFYGGIRFTAEGAPAGLKLVRLRGGDAPSQSLTPPISRPHTDETFYLVSGTAR